MNEELRKGLFLPEQEEFLAEVLDKFFKFKNPLIETFDKSFFKILIQTGDNSGLDKISESWKAQIIPIVDAAMTLNVEKTRRLITDFMNARIDIPKIDEDTELVVFDSFSRFIVAAINWYIVNHVKNAEKPVE